MFWKALHKLTLEEKKKFLGECYIRRKSVLLCPFCGIRKSCSSQASLACEVRVTHSPVECSLFQVAPIYKKSANIDFFFENIDFFPVIFNSACCKFGFFELNIETSVAVSSFSYPGPMGWAKLYTITCLHGFYSTFRLRSVLCLCSVSQIMNSLLPNSDLNWRK